MSYYSPDEIKILIDNINTDFKCGIRDKCMIVLLAQTGLRASDVVWLRFDEINWDKQVISKRQIKTNQPVIVPFTNQARYLLIDYIKNHRKSSDNKFIFINSTTLQPFKSASVLTGICRKNFIKAEINIINRKAGCHSLRHSLATNLIKENTPMPVITGILGHKSVETTERYISIDIEGLRQVSLEVPYA
ncbi:MAG: tyrosine-type recombinase/integrase [Erysipelotrichaceae bacterium]|nr:tyrosine-type recombinase/integrase [Erysipelotrichaceae bacterium]